MSESIKISPALSALCQRHGIDFSDQSILQIAAILPRIFAAVISEQQSTKALIAKSALHIHQIATYCPTEFERDETVGSMTDEFQNQNDIFSSLMPG